MSLMSGSQRRLTYDDFLLFPDDGKRHEIIDGVHYLTPSPNLTHQELLGRLYLAIGNFLSTRRHIGRVFLSPLDVVMSKYDVVEPDLLFVAGDQQFILTEANVQGPPALVVEILSPGTRRRDEGIKRRLFDEKGVREYWMVDPRSRRITICRRAPNGGFPVVATCAADGNDHVTSPLLPEFTLPVRDLFTA
jgi:Uma2 family endonuclease